MKILLTTDWYAPAVNGVVTSVQNLRRGLEERGHEVRVLTLSRGPRSEEKDGTYYLASVGAGAVYPGARVRVPLPSRMMEELQSWKPDIVHSNCEFSTFPAACRIAKQASAPLLHTYHTVYENYTHYFSPSRTWGRSLVRRFTRWAARRTDAVIAPTEKTAALLRSYGVCRPLYVIPTGIAPPQGGTPEEAQRLRRRLGIPRGQTIMLFLGRLAREKNCAELLRAMARLRDRPVTLLLAGDGPDRSALERLSGELRLGGRVVFAGMIPPDEVGRYYQLADLFVSASTSETQGMTYAEALMSGVPLLCRRDACLDGVVHEGTNGWQYSGEEQFLSAVRTFLPANQEKREALRAGARETGAAFSVDTFACRAEAAYLDCLSAGHRERGVCT